MQLGAIDFGTTVLAYGAEADVESEGIDLAGLSGEARRIAAPATYSMGAGRSLCISNAQTQDGFVGFR